MEVWRLRRGEVEVARAVDLRGACECGGGHDFTQASSNSTSVAQASVSVGTVTKAGCGTAGDASLGVLNNPDVGHL
jgi:hypothetical protein